MDKTDLNAFLAPYHTKLSDDNYAGIEHRGLFINIQTDENMAVMCLYSALGTLPDPLPAEIAEELLTANLLGMATDGGHIGFYPPSRTVVYSCRLPLQKKSPDEMEEFLIAFTEHVFAWVEQLDSAHLEKAKEACLELTMARGPMLWG